MKPFNDCPTNCDDDCNECCFSCIHVGTSECHYCCFYNRDNDENCHYWRSTDVDAAAKAKEE